MSNAGAFVLARRSETLRQTGEAKKDRENNISVTVRLENENVWLTQANLVDLY